MRISRFIARCVWALLLVPALAQAVNVTATLDRSQVQLGETVTLNLRIDGANGSIAMPDLQALHQDFNVLGTSQSNNLTVINGQATSTLTIGVALRPTHVGTLQIPALDVAGSRTSPLQLQVTAAAPNTAAVGNQDVFLQAQVTPAHGYVGQQLSYVVRLYYAVNLSGGTLSAPTVDGMQVSQVGKDLNYDDQQGGRDYHVLERRYALIPQHAGHVEIPPASFQGQSVDPNDPNSFFGAGTPVVVNSASVSVDVQPAPANWGKSAWLPARQLSLTMQGWPGAQDQVRVGQPLNLTMKLQATGLPFETLPTLSLPPLDGARTYPDKPTGSTLTDGPWLIGQRQQAFAIVPERSGTLTIPATTLKWWNVLTGQMETAQIPAHSVTVLPAIGATAATPAPASSSAVAGAAATESSTATTPATTPWRWIALGSIGLWLLSMLAWWWQRRRKSANPASVSSSKPDAPASSPRQCQLAFLAAARGSDPAAQVHTLLAWARVERPAIQHLGDLSSALADAPQRDAIADLQQRHYASSPMPADGAALAEAFKRGFVWRIADAGDKTSVLPPLYPFKLHPD